MLVWDPPRRFSFEWEDDKLHFTLTEVDQGCRVELVNILSKDGAAARNAAGWEMCPGHLDRVVAGTWAAPPSAGSMAEFLPVLQKYKTRGLPDDGWLPDETS